MTKEEHIAYFRNLRDNNVDQWCHDLSNEIYHKLLDVNMDFKLVKEVRREADKVYIYSYDDYALDYSFQELCDYLERDLHNDKWYKELDIDITI